MLMVVRMFVEAMKMLVQWGSVVWAAVAAVRMHKARGLTY
jgi:hypothetical protein